MWTKVAHHRASHGENPQRAVEHAVAELETTARMDARRPDAWAAMSDALATRARFQRDRHEDARPALAQARAALEKALAIDGERVPARRYRIMLAELDAEVVLERHGDPSSAVRSIRADAQQLLRQLPSDGLAHRGLCRADLLAARWALARGEATDRLLAHAATEAAQAREADPMDAMAWTVSAEVEQMRAEVARAKRLRPDADIAAARAFTSRALGIDPRLVRALKLRDELLR